MADIEIIHQHTRGFSETGQVSERSESFVKILTSFRRGSLRRLKGAPLSVFMCVALHEADFEPGCSLTVMCQETGYTRPSIIDAIRFLTDDAQRFIEEAGLESDGTKRYRVTAFAWFGQKPKPPELPQLPQDTGSKKILLPTPSKKFLPPHDMNDDIQHQNNVENSFIHDSAATRKILQDAGIQGKNLELLAKSVSPEIAQTWADWLERVDRTVWTRPEGFAFRQMSDDPTKRAPFIAAKSPRRPTISGRLADIAWYDDDQSKLIQR